MSDAEKIKRLREALRDAFDWIDAVPKDVADALPPMPGFDRDEAEALLMDQPDD